MLSNFQNHECQQGLTLLEFLVTVAIAAILLTTVAPNIQGMLYRNQIVNDINETSSALQFARFSAVDFQDTAVVCPSSNFQTCVTSNWNLPKIVFIDSNGNGNRDTDERLLYTTEPVSGSNSMVGADAVIEFDTTGATNINLELLLCAGNSDPTLTRQIHVNAQGRIRLSRDSDGDGVHESPAGTALSCS